MADFCADCSKELFGKDFGDLSSLVTQEDWDHGYCAIALCEGCGPTWVDPQGNCVRLWCFSQTPGHSTQTNCSPIEDVPGVKAKFATGVVVKISAEHHEFPGALGKVESCEVARTPDGPSLKYFVRFDEMLAGKIETGETIHQDWVEVEEQEIQLASD